jgi:signal transduction histidine kinase/CheY-like chemotaxis protein
MQELTNNCFRIINRSRHAGQFVLLGVVPAAEIPPSSDPPVDFRWSAGDKLAIRSAISDSTADIWRQAMHSKSVVGRESRHSGLPSEAFRVAAFPLLVANDSAGVLVVRMHSSLASFATLVRLELFAHLASSALTIAAQKQAAGAAELSRFFLQSSSQPAFLLNGRLEIISASPSANEIWPHLREPATSSAAAIPLPAPAFRLFRPADWQRVSEWMQRVSETGVSGETRALSAELHTGPSVRLSAFPFSPAGLFLLVQDARIGTDSVRTRDALELHTLVEWMDQGVLLFDQHESLRAISPRFAQLFGLTAADLERAASLRELVELIAPRVSDPAHFAESWWAAARGSEPAAPEELRIVHPAPRTLERISRPNYNSAGDRLGRLEIYSDLTPQQLFRSKLHKMERLAALGQNVSGVAHELSNPLTTILGYAERLLRNSADRGHRAEIQRISSEADRAVSILRQLLASARESPAPRHPVDVNPVVLRTVELERFQLASEKIHLQLDLAAALPPVLADPGQLQQILLNLISNARHALLELKRSGAILVRTSVNQSSCVMIEVSDTGPGIPEAHRHRIFDPFVTTKPAGIGTGLGLSIVMGLVRQNDGNIRMQSPPGKGATFLIDFPALKADVPMFAPQLPPALSAPPPAPASGRVLVVEDEPTVAQLLADMLADLGFAADVQQDARRALVSALNRDYSLIICDMKMPVLDGQHFYRALTEAGSPLASRFLFVTGDVLGLATQEFLRKHRLPYIAKPFRLEEFSEKLAVVLNQAAAASASTAVLLNDRGSNNLLSHG